MLLSEFIKELEQIKEIHGDHIFWIFAVDCYGHFSAIKSKKLYVNASKDKQDPDSDEVLIRLNY